MITKNQIEKITTEALNLSIQDYKLLIDELIKILETTTINDCRNTVAIVLSDLNCDKAVEPLIKLIHNTKIKNSRGSLIYALENFNIADRLDSFIELLVVGNFEVKHNVYTLFEKQLTNMSKEKKESYIKTLKERILATQESLNLMEDLCFEVFQINIKSEN